MRYWYLTLVAVFLLNSAGWSKPIQIEPYGYFWFRYEQEIEENTGVVEQNNFTIPRGYLRFKAEYDEDIEGRLTIDISGEKKLETGSASGTTLEASTHKHEYKDNTRVRLKYAYVAIKNILPNAKLQIGLQKNYFGNIDLWNYPTIQKAMEDAEGIMKSADLGIVLNGNILESKADYQLGIYNGAGYEQIVDETNINDKTALLSVGVVPIPGLYIRGSYRTEREGAGSYSGTQNAVLAEYKRDPFWFLADVVNADTGTIKKNGTDLFGAFKLNELLQLKIRTYTWDPDTATGNDKYTYAIFGFNYQYAPDLLLQFDYQAKTYENTASDGLTSYIAQAKWSF